MNHDSPQQDQAPDSVNLNPNKQQKPRATMNILESLKRNAARKSNLDADKNLLTQAAREIEQLRHTLKASLVAMRIASRLPGVANEYDFEPVIGEVVAALKD